VPFQGSNWPLGTNPQLGSQVRGPPHGQGIKDFVHSCLRRVELGEVLHSKGRFSWKSCAIPLDSPVMPEELSRNSCRLQSALNSLRRGHRNATGNDLNRYPGPDRTPGDCARPGVVEWMSTCRPVRGSGRAAWLCAGWIRRRRGPRVLDLRRSSPARGGPSPSSSSREYSGQREGCGKGSCRR
jgi:hypothetical protein